MPCGVLFLSVLELLHLGLIIGAVTSVWKLGEGGGGGGWGVLLILVYDRMTIIHY